MRFKFFTLLFLTSVFMGAQNTPNIETCFNLGFASFQTDYGERGDFKSGVSGNVGLAIGASLYINFFNNDPMNSVSPSWAQKHFKLKAEASYLSAKLNHFGEYAEGGYPESTKLKNMHGSSSIINAGFVLEYHPFVIPDFVPGLKRRVSPYFGGGIMAGYSMPTLESDLGDWETNPSLLISAYKGEAISLEPVLTYSVVFSTGLRYNIDSNSAVIIDSRWQYFNTDYIDGLKPNAEIVANKYNDWLTYINIGYVFKFGGSGKSSTW